MKFPSGWKAGSFWRVLAGLLLLTVVISLLIAGMRDGTDRTDRADRTDRTDPPVSSLAPDRDGYFATKPAGSWEKLPSDKACARQVHRSTWEPRPSNATANRTMPKLFDARTSLTSRLRGDGRTYAFLFNVWLLPRVSGQHTGSTDENIQWAACKWGISDNLLRAMAAAESTWFQGLRERDGSCVQERGCGDMVEQATAASRQFCEELSRFGYDYTRDYGDGVCPKTFSIIGVMAWQDPLWGRMSSNQNGTFPFSRDSTAFALDYAAAQLRGCMEGWVAWLSERGEFRRGDIWGCVGFWFRGDWKDPEAQEYAERVKSLMDDRFWLQPDFAEDAQL